MRSPLLKTILAALITFNLAATARAALKVGDAFPDLAGFKLEGKLPDDMKGKIVFVDFWASWCEPCKQSFPVIDELQKKYGAQGFVVIAINEDESRADMDDFLKHNAASFAIVRDAGQKLVDKIEIGTMPASFILDRDGKVRFAHNGFHGDKTKKEYEKEIESLLAK